MKVIDPGHTYVLRLLDDERSFRPFRYPFGSTLIFVKREGANYPGNIGSHSGTTTQEVLRALIDRTKYVNNQIPDERNKQVLYHLRSAILELEIRAAQRHGRLLDLSIFDQIEDQPTCDKCNHIGCAGTCH